MADLDARIRSAALARMDELQRTYGEIFPRKVLMEGIVVDGFHIPFVVQWGIWKPRTTEVPLTITTAPRYGGNEGRVFDSDGLMRYAYQGFDPSHYQNRGLREAINRRVPLIYFHGIERGLYRAFWPVYIVGDDASTMSFTVSEQPPSLARLDAQGLNA